MPEPRALYTFQGTGGHRTLKGRAGQEIFFSSFPNGIYY
jgi:hypothetical protein